ncbi:MAG: type I glyceraldehyde-3-phosphate dehydrogenase [Patescibacteria group bacterium]|nr:type I glyceraldehyde-3-phosphate dehydrogenase [Patescibacteria group bacterium]
MIKVAINGFGRIGRIAFKNILENHPDLDVSVINDLTDPKTLAHLLKYDSCFGVYNKSVSFEGDSIIVNNKKIKIFSETQPENLPWGEMKIDIVLECTGVFRSSQGAEKHLKAGAKKVIISAPSSSEEIPLYVLGVNEEKYNPKKDEIISMGSCTTNCVAPLVKIINNKIGMKKGLFTTVHSYTTNQRILDLPHKDLRRARAAAINIVPTTTGAAKAVEKCIPEIKGKLDGIAIRVPNPVVSIIDVVVELKKEITGKELINVFRKASKTKKLNRILKVEDAPLVSTDYKGNPFSCIIDSNMARTKGNLIKILAWYDNEWAYATRLAELAEYIGKK